MQAFIYTCVYSNFNGLSTDPRKGKSLIKKELQLGQIFPNGFCNLDETTNAETIPKFVSHVLYNLPTVTLNDYQLFSTMSTFFTVRPDEVNMVYSIKKLRFLTSCLTPL